MHENLSVYFLRDAICSFFWLFFCDKFVSGDLTRGKLALKKQLSGSHRHTLTPLPQ